MSEIINSGKKIKVLLLTPLKTLLSHELSDSGVVVMWFRNLEIKKDVEM